MSYFIIIILIISYSWKIFYVIFLSNVFHLSRTEKHVELADIFLLIYKVFILYSLMLCYLPHRFIIIMYIFIVDYTLCHSKVIHVMLFAAFCFEFNCLILR